VDYISPGEPSTWYLAFLNQKQQKMEKRPQDDHAHVSSASESDEISRGMKSSAADVHDMARMGKPQEMRVCATQKHPVSLNPSSREEGEKEYVH
jgi:hypothetical protein